MKLLALLSFIPFLAMAVPTIPTNTPVAQTVTVIGNTNIMPVTAQTIIRSWIPTNTNTINDLTNRITVLEGGTSNWNTAYSWGDWSPRVSLLEGRTNDWNTAYGWGDWGPRVSLLEGMTNLINSALQVEHDPEFEQWLLTDPGSIYALKSVVSTQVWSTAQYPLAMLAADLAAVTNPIPSWIVAGDAAGSNNVTAAVAAEVSLRLAGDQAGSNNVTAVVAAEALLRVAGDAAGITNTAAVRSELLNSNAQARAAIDLRPTFPAVTSIVEAVAVTTETDEIALEALAQYAAYWPKDATASSWFTFTTNANEITITGYDIDGGADVVIPDYINGYPVTAIGDAAFSPGDEGMEITSVGGAGKVKTIGACAFYYCTSLATVSLPQAQTIGDSAFFTCLSLATVSLPQAQTIGDSAFFTCLSLTTVSLPQAQTIGDFAFYYCSSLTAVSLPQAQTIGCNVFDSCISLATVSLPQAQTIGTQVFDACPSLATVSFPQVQTIGDYAFAYCPSLTSVYFGQNAPAEGMDVYMDSPNVTNYVTNPTATGWGATWNERPVVRLPLYGPGDNLTGVVKPADLPDLTNAIPSWITAAIMAAIMQPGEYYLGTNATINVATNFVCFRANVTSTWELAVDAGTPRYPRDLVIIGTNGSIIPSYIVDNRQGPAAVTNLYYLRPLGPEPSTNWWFQ